MTLSFKYKAISVFIILMKSEIHISLKVLEIFLILVIHLHYLFDIYVRAIYLVVKTAQIEIRSNNIQDNCRCIQAFQFAKNSVRQVSVCLFKGMVLIARNQNIRRRRKRKQFVMRIECLAISKKAAPVCYFFRTNFLYGLQFEEFDYLLSVLV